MTEFERLHPAVQYHVVNSLGWSTLRPTQLQAIEPIQAGRHCLLLAPTAGGKTEAAVIPVLSRMAIEDWRGLSVLYICPIKALLNNLEPRLSRYASLLGRRVEVWHGDVGDSRKRRALRDPPDILLTTPESLEGMLVSPRVERAAWLGGLRTVIVDELHAIASDDRGWHLRALLWRLNAYTDAPVQRIGLSATVGNPAALLEWFAPSGERQIVGSSHVSTNAEVTVDAVGSTENAALVVSRLYRGEKRLVFCDSRSTAEKLGSSLNQLGVRTYVSHASLSASERKAAEAAFAEERDCVIVATSTLELGIDVGDLDRVIQIDSPSSVSSFLQRMGRAGRREGSVRNCLFLTTSDAALLLALGVCRLWADGWVEPAEPPGSPWNVVAQQALLTLVESSPRPTRQWMQALCLAFPEVSPDELRQLLEHLIAQGFVAQDAAGLVQIGPSAERQFGGAHYRDLMATFSGAELLTGRHGASDVGYLDPAVLSGQGEECIVLLAGRSWRVRETDWKRRIVWLEPAAASGRARWLGGSRDMRAELAASIRGVLQDGCPQHVRLSNRASAALDDIRDVMPASEEAYVEPVANGRFRMWTYAGTRANRRRTCEDMAKGAGRYDGLTVEYRRDPRLEVESLVSAGQAIDSAKLQELAAEFKFSNLLPGILLTDMVLSRRL